MKKKFLTGICLLALFITLIGSLSFAQQAPPPQTQDDDENARGIFQREEGDGFMLDILLKRPATDVWLSVPPDTVFHNHDRVKLALRSNFDGYIYIVNIGTSGARRIMVPGPISNENQLQKGAYQQFMVGELTGAPGEETLYIISAPTRIKEFDDAIANNNGLLTATTTPTKPVAQPLPNSSSNVDNKLKKSAPPVFSNKHSRIGILKSVGSQVIKVLGIVSLFSRELTSEYSTDETRTFIASPDGRLKGGEFAAFELILKHE